VPVPAFVPAEVGTDQELPDSKLTALTCSKNGSDEGAPQQEDSKALPVHEACGSVQPALAYVPPTPASRRVHMLAQRVAPRVVSSPTQRAPLLACSAEDLVEEGHGAPGIMMGKGVAHIGTRAPSPSSSLSHVVSCTPNSVVGPSVSPPTCSASHGVASGSCMSHTPISRSLPISKLTKVVKSKPLVKVTMCHGGSGSGPVAERHRRQVRIAPSIARAGLGSSFPPCDAKQRGGIDSSGEVRVIPLLAESGSMVNPSGAQVQHQLSHSGGAAKRRRQSENMVNSNPMNLENLVRQRPSNLRIWTDKPNDDNRQAHNISVPDALPSRPNLLKQIRVDEGCNFLHRATERNDSASTAENTLRVQQGDGCAPATPPQQKCAHTDRRPVAGLLANPPTVSRDCVPHDADDQTRLPARIGCPKLHSE